ncbi:myb family DNA-binding domain containing protein [Entamoeba histolytica HM-1:IMSS-B]|uniref:Myb-like DNA-binding domain containing protein n=8 Tax=Entamoeba TaxID=5758 RepID=B1N395_ENTH1|nr:myb-like DNA-binding domain containing protein [Entamoeba histolytica HM-1:IMSS]XP_008860536.1 myb family DNA-binding domain containing protein [Entamoeba nuttalli P19]EMD48841.1 myb family DNAbinding domain containing protein [Entamoeba histolytica KU27]EMH78091.1 myb family DNA-binding domain containing protein [Entamoeba histolytica HM-1:IMSS-B]EMS14950.1 myb family DNA-binding domain containing protein [Entamoeba histolytica HM-3:IMSS]ENY60447.1 myb family DNA-binding domain containing |eukprot:XP_008860536.1 myb family DNA-binding domain containing protein [Entamoeba nuttalli P19]
MTEQQNSSKTKNDKDSSIDLSTLSMRQICKLSHKKQSSIKKLKELKQPFNRYLDEECIGEISNEKSGEENGTEHNSSKRSNLLKPKKSKKWDKEEILKLYTGIMKYGADFGLIELMFDGRTRKQIKAKFKAEERIRPKMIEKALNAQQTMDTNLLQETLDLIGKQHDLSSSSDEVLPRPDVF